jgi:hypothetical protein
VRRDVRGFIDLRKEDCAIDLSALNSWCFRTSSNSAEVFTFSVAWSSPWMILPTLISRLIDSESTKASNAVSNLSSVVSLFRQMKRMRMNCAALPRRSNGMRSTA